MSGRTLTAHVFLCMLAYYVERHMHLALAPVLFADNEPSKREGPPIVQPAEPQEAKRKIAMAEHGWNADHGLARSYRQS